MKCLLLVVLACLACVPEVGARIGETREQCRERYGEPVSLDEDGDSATYEKGGFRIRLFFFEDVCEWLTLVKFAEGSREAFQAIEDIEIETFLGANGGEREWVASEGATVGELAWKTTDGTLHATYRSEPDHLLSVFVEAARQRRSFSAAED